MPRSPSGSGLSGRGGTGIGRVASRELMASRFFQGPAWAAILALTVVFSVPADLPRGGEGGIFAGSSAQAAPRKKSKKRRRARGPIKPEIVDDAKRPAGDVLGAQMDSFFKSNRPLYASFVAIRPSTGELLTFSEYARDKGARVRNPGLYTGFPAASVFKIVSTAALIEDAHVKPGLEVCYTGGSRQLTSANLVDRKKERSCKTLTQAFASSTNAVFGKLAVKHLTADTLMEMASRFGFGRKITVSGHTSTSKVRRPEGRLSLARMAAGFTGTNMSTLHGAVIGAIIANDGIWPPGVSLGGSGAGGVSMTVVKPETARELARMMVRAVEHGTGSKHLASLKASTGHSPAIKTGSLTSRDGSGIWNNWIVGFYPADKPEIAFAAHVGHQGGGYLKAGHIVRYALDTWVALNKSRR